MTLGERRAEIVIAAMMPEPERTVEPEKRREEKTAEATERTAAKEWSRSEAGGGDRGDLFSR